MIYKVLEATKKYPIKTDFVNNCDKYLSLLKINLSFEEIGSMSKGNIKKLVKLKTKEAAFQYLTEKKDKQSKISHVNYDELRIQEYLLEGNKNTEVSRFVFKARAKCLDIKMQKQWKYKDILCIGCGVESETGDELISCLGYSNDKVIEPMFYDWFFNGPVSEMNKLAKEMKRRLKVRDKMLEEIN